MDYSIGSRAKHLDEAGWYDSYYPEEWGPNNYRRDEIKQASCTVTRANKIKLSLTPGLTLMHKHLTGSLFRR